MLVREIEEGFPILAKEGVAAGAERVSEHSAHQLSVRRQFLRGEIPRAEQSVNGSRCSQHFQLPGGIDPGIGPPVGEHRQLRVGESNLRLRAYETRPSTGPPASPRPRYRAGHVGLMRPGRAPARLKSRVAGGRFELPRLGGTCV